LKDGNKVIKFYTLHYIYLWSHTLKCAKEGKRSLNCFPEVKYYKFSLGYN